jgi:penicillin-binding protein 2
MTGASLVLYRPALKTLGPQRIRGRLLLIVVLIASMLATLLGRLYYVQLLDPNKPTQTAGALNNAAIVIPAPRGQILDARGRPLVDNTSTQVITLDRQALDRLPDKGASVYTELAGLLGGSANDIRRETTPCSPTVAAPCWTGQPYQPVPIATNAKTEAVLAISEHAERFPGITVRTVTQPTYPNGSLASHVLGYTTQVSEADQKADPTLGDDDQIGVSGLEEQYDKYLRGTNGTQDVLLNPQGYSVDQGAYKPPVQGDTLVTSIDLDVQKLAEQSLARQIKDSRARGRAATSGSIVVMDPNTGRIIAAASYPTYDPQLFVGGISQADYARLTAPSANTPMLFRATQGQYAPGSTFKLISTSSLVQHREVSLKSTYPCPGSVTIDGRVKTNFDSESFAWPMTVQDILGYSCDTFFYRHAADEYYTDERRIDAGKQAREWLQRTAGAFGVGESPGVDLPAGEQASGSYADRELRQSRWEQNKKTYCAEAGRGYPEVKNIAQRNYLTRLASENCTDGWRYRAGDNADLAIGQGETTVSPLQLAIAYSAMFNGGKIMEPTFGWAVVDGTGKVVQKIQPKVKRTLDIAPSTFDYIAKSLNFGRGWAVSGAFAYLDSPYKAKIGGKTGTAEVEGKDDTSWLASWGPVSKTKDGHVTAKFVMVGMIEQAGTGAKAAGPMLKRVWDGIFGADGKKPVLPGQRAPAELPEVVQSTTVGQPR